MELDKITRDYIRDHGYDPAELDEETLREAVEEAHCIANGGCFLDGVFFIKRGKPKKEFK